MLSFKHCEMSSLPPSTPALQRIPSGDRQAIMTEVSQIDAAGSAVLGGLLYSDAAVPKAAQKAVDAAEKKAEIARKRAASRTSTATPTKRIYKPKRASQLTKEVIIDPRLEEIGLEQSSVVGSEYPDPEDSQIA